MCLKQVVLGLILKYTIRLKDDRHFQFVIPSECTAYVKIFILKFSVLQGEEWIVMEMNWTVIKFNQHRDTFVLFIIDFICDEYIWNIDLH